MNAWLGHQDFSDCVYKTVVPTFTSTCSFYTTCLLQFPPTEVLKGVDRFLSLCRTINHDSESWWLCNCGYSLHSRGLSPAILSLSNIRLNATTFRRRGLAVCEICWCGLSKVPCYSGRPVQAKWWNSFSFLFLETGSLGCESVEIFLTPVSLVRSVAD